MSIESYFCISVRITHPSLDPAEISARLGIVPSNIGRVGEARTTPKGTPLGGVNKASFWAYTFPGQKRGELSELLRSMNQILMPQKDFLQSLRSSDGNIEYFIGWFINGNTGEVLDAQILAETSSLGIGLSFDVYQEDKRPQDDT